MLAVQWPVSLALLSYLACHMRVHAEKGQRTCKGHDDVREVHAAHEAAAPPAGLVAQPVWVARAEQLPNFIHIQLYSCK